MRQRSATYHKPESSANASQQWKERLRQLGLLPANQLYNLIVNPGAVVELRPDHPSFRQCYVNIKIRDSEHFLELFGPGMRIKHEHRLKPLPIPSHLQVRAQSASERRAAELVARALMGEVSSWDDKDRRLADSWIAGQKIRATVALFADIYVSAHSRFVLGSTVLVARFITIERDGQIVIPPGRHTKIDCKGIEALKFGATVLATSSKFRLTPATLS